MADKAQNPTSAWTPVDESTSGWTAVDEPKSAAPEPATDWLSKLIGQKEQPAIESALQPSMHSPNEGIFDSAITGAGNVLKGAGHFLTHPEELVTGAISSFPPVAAYRSVRDAYKHIEGEPNDTDTEMQQMREHPAEGLEYGLGEMLPLALTGGAESLPSKGRAAGVFADIERQAANTPVYMTETSPAVKGFQEFVKSGGRNARVMTKLGRRIENTPPRPLPGPIPINRIDRLLGAGTEDIPLVERSGIEPAESPMAFNAERLPQKNISSGTSPRVEAELGSTAKTIPSRLHREAYMSGSEHPELSGRAPAIEGVLRRPRVFEPQPEAPAPDYAPPLNFPEARRFYSNVSELSRRPGFLRRAVESPSAPKMRYQLGGVRQAMNSDLTNALPPELSDRYTNALREYAQAAKLGKVAKGAGAVALAEGLRRSGILGKVFSSVAQ